MSAPNKSYDPVEVTALHPDEVARVRGEALAAVAAAASLDELTQVRRAHAGDRSPLALAHREIGALPPHAKAEAGKRVGAARRAISEAVQARQAELEEERDQRVLAEESVDVTLPWDRVPRGARHPVTTIQERMADVFVRMGFEIAEGPEVEAHCCDAGTVPPTPQDAFFIESLDSGLVLRTHAWPMLARALLTREPPVYVVSTGRTFGTDELQETHGPVLHQVAGLVVDEGSTLADLRGAIDAFVSGMFGAGVRARLRPYSSRFTEPSATVDLPCLGCRGASAEPDGEPCRTCRSAGWLELGGCGMVDPRVLATCGVDPGRYSGWAFGLSVEQVLMVRHGVEDMQAMVEGDVRFTRAFGMEI